MNNLIALDRPGTRLKNGRKPGYSPELAEQFLARLSGGLSVERVCRHKDMPSKSQVYRWISERSDFREKYAQALSARGIKHGDDVIAIAERVISGDLAPERGRVAIDALKWAASRMAPRVYGDRLALTGHDGGEIGMKITDARATIEGKLARLASVG